MTGEYDIETPALRVNVYRHGELAAQVLCESADEAADVVARVGRRRGRRMRARGPRGSACRNRGAGGRARGHDSRGRIPAPNALSREDRGRSRRVRAGEAGGGVVRPVCGSARRGSRRAARDRHAVLRLAGSGIRRDATAVTRGPRRARRPGHERMVLPARRRERSLPGGADRPRSRPRDHAGGERGTGRLRCGGAARPGRFRRDVAREHQLRVDAPPRPAAPDHSLTRRAGFRTGVPGARVRRRGRGCRS